MITMSPGCTSCGHDGRFGTPRSPRGVHLFDLAYWLGRGQPAQNGGVSFGAKCSRQLRLASARSFKPRAPMTFRMVVKSGLRSPESAL